MKDALHILLFAVVLAAAPLACDRTTSTPVTPMTPTAVPATATNTPVPSSPTPTPVIVSVVSGPFRYSVTGSSGSAISAPITVAVGQEVIWDTSNDTIHPLYIDDGAGNCNVSGNLTFPMTQTFSSTGDYTFHCGNHGTCTGGSSVCTLPCSNMTGVVHVQ